MIYALKKVSEYSRRRMMVLIWTAMFMFLMLVIDVISETGIGAGYSSLFTIFDLVNVIVLFIAIRALIIPVESYPDMECNFSSEEERIQELEFKNKIIITTIIRKLTYIASRYGFLNACIPVSETPTKPIKSNKL